MGILSLTIKEYEIIINFRTDLTEVSVMLDKITEAEINREMKVISGGSLRDVYGIGCERMVLGIIVEAMLSAGCRKGSIAHVMNEAIDAIDELSVKEFQDINNDYLTQKYKKSRLIKM